MAQGLNKLRIIFFSWEEKCSNLMALLSISAVLLRGDNLQKIIHWKLSVLINLSEFRYIKWQNSFCNKTHYVECWDFSGGIYFVSLLTTPSGRVYFSGEEVSLVLYAVKSFLTIKFVYSHLYLALMAQLFSTNTFSPNKFCPKTYGKLLLN